MPHRIDLTQDELALIFDALDNALDHLERDPAPREPDVHDQLCALFDKLRQQTQ